MDFETPRNFRPSSIGEGKANLRSLDKTTQRHKTKDRGIVIMSNTIATLPTAAPASDVVIYSKLTPAREIVLQQELDESSQSRIGDGDANR